jgi:DNA-binding MarR family transcriptional regulator
MIELLREVNHSIGKYIKEVIVRHDTPPTTMIITRHIWAEPGITISELARRTGIAKSHISNTIRDLDEKGWVEKKADAADQRLIHLHLTYLAIEELAQVRIDIRQRLRALVSSIPEQQAADLVTGLKAVKSALDQAQEKDFETGKVRDNSNDKEIHIHD